MADCSAAVPMVEAPVVADRAKVVPVKDGPKARDDDLRVRVLPEPGLPVTKTVLVRGDPVKDDHERLDRAVPVDVALAVVRVAMSNSIRWSA